MEPKPRWGITLPLPGIALADQREIVAGLPGLGYTDAWSSEVNGTDAFTPLVLAAQWASELRLGTAIAPIYTRGPAVLAMSGAALAGLAPGRFVLGIGTSSPAVVERWNAAELDRPYQRARDMLSFLRQALTGEKVTEEYETFRVDGFRLEPAPAAPPALALAALRPQMIRLAAAKADAAITNWLAPHDVPMVRAVAVPAYAAFHAWLGRGEAMAPMQDAWAAGDRKRALEVIGDEVVDDLIVHGAPQACRERVAEYQAKGLDTPVIAVVPPPGTNVPDLVRQLSPAG